MKENIKLSYFWTIPFLLSIVAGLLNPYGGIIGVMIPIFAFVLLLIIQKSIVQDAKRIEQKYKSDGKVVFGLLLNNWMATAFSFLILNSVFHFFLFYMCNMYVNMGDSVPMFSYAIHDIFISNWNLIYFLFFANVFFHIIGTIMIFINGNHIKKKLHPSLIQGEGEGQEIEEKPTKIVEFLDIKPKEMPASNSQDSETLNGNFGIEEDKE